jgi:hypothetical protein
VSLTDRCWQDRSYSEPTPPISNPAPSRATFVPSSFPHAQPLRPTSRPSTHSAKLPTLATLSATIVAGQANGCPRHAFVSPSLSVPILSSVGGQSKKKKPPVDHDPRQETRPTVRDWERDREGDLEWERVRHRVRYRVRERDREKGRAPAFASHAASRMDDDEEDDGGLLLSGHELWRFRPLLTSNSLMKIVTRSLRKRRSVTNISQTGCKRWSNSV